MDDEGTKVFRWVDNNIVTFVSTIHDIEASVEANRKRPRMTATNKKHVAEVWGDKHVKKIEIPQFINDYNFWMGGVDRADQLIAAYSMKNRCRRTWMPFLLYIINIVRVNSFITHRELKGTKTHMEFTLEFAMSMFQRRLDVPLTRKRQMEEATAENGSGQSVKHSRIRSDPGPLPEMRLHNPEQHVPTHSTVRLRCYYCRFLAFHAKKKGEEAKQPCSTVKVCLKCNGLPLCKLCFKAYHSTESEIIEV